jgi:hypothetical protein
VSQITTTLKITEKGGYSYTPNSVIVTQFNTTLIYQLDPQTAIEWEIVGLTNTDSKNQLSGESKAPSGISISILDANTKAEVFDVTVVVQHRTKRDRILRVDPQVENEPPV